MPAEGPRLRNLLCRIGPQTPWWAPFFIDIRASERRVSTNKRLGRRYNPNRTPLPGRSAALFSTTGNGSYRDQAVFAPSQFHLRLYSLAGRTIPILAIVSGLGGLASMRSNAHASTIPDPFFNRIVLTTERVSMRLLAIADTNMRNSSHVAMRLFRLVVAH